VIRFPRIVARQAPRRPQATLNIVSFEEAIFPVGLEDVMPMLDLPPSVACSLRRSRRVTRASKILEILWAVLRADGFCSEEETDRKKNLTFNNCAAAALGQRVEQTPPGVHQAMQVPPPTQGMPPYFSQTPHATESIRRG